MEEEWVGNQEQLKPQEERNEEDRTKVSIRVCEVGDIGMEPVFEFVEVNLHLV